MIRLLSKIFHKKDTSGKMTPTQRQVLTKGQTLLDDLIGLDKNFLDVELPQIEEKVTQIEDTMNQVLRLSPEEIEYLISLTSNERK